MSIQKIIEDTNLSEEQIYKNYFENQKNRFEDVFEVGFFSNKDISKLKQNNSGYFKLNNFSTFSPFLYALSLSNFKFINAFITYLKNQHANFNPMEIRVASYYTEYKLSEILFNSIESSKFNEKQKTILAQFFSFSKQPYHKNSSYYRAVISWALKNKNEDLLNYFAPLIVNRYPDVFLNIVKKNPLKEVEYLHSILEKNIHVNKQDLYKIKEQYIAEHVLDVYFFFDICKNITKKDFKIQKENLEYLLKKSNKESIFKTIYDARKKTKGKTDPYSSLNRYKDNPVLILIQKDAINALNIFLDNGYIPDEDEIKLVLNSSNFSDIKAEHKHFFENNSVDRLETLVKGFEVHLLKRQKTSIKKLKDFMLSLSREDKEYLYSYYEQFKETNLSSYSFLNVQGINNDRISIIDHIVKNGFYEQINLLLEHDFIFTQEQIRKFFDCFSINNENAKFSEFDVDFSFEKFLINLKKYLSDDEIKIMLAYNVTYGHKISFLHMDKIYDILLKDLTFNSFEINHILSGHNQCIALLYKFYKNNLNHFFNHNSFYNYSKDFYLFMIFYFTGPKKNRIHIHEHLTDSKVFIELLASVIKNIPNFEKPFFNKINECLNSDKAETINKMHSRVEKAKIMAELPDSENTGTDKVKIRRRI